MGGHIQSVRGMPDLLPDAVALWQDVERAIRRVSDLYGYLEIRLPLLERTELFKRSIGEATDIVEKEMYTFADNSGESITLRPEATASCVRAGIQHGLFHNSKARLWYMGPMFRYERPQKGRFRQFHQYGIEAFGWTGPDIDAELMLVGQALWRQLNIAGSVELQINSLGEAESRAQYRTALVDYFERYRDSLDSDSLRRLTRNPLRILDSKNPDLQDLIAGAPTLAEYLGEQSRSHFEKLQAMLDDLGIAYSVNPRLVRGLDYYSGTVFEWIAGQGLGAQNAVCAGGRYDGLVRHLGGGAVPGAGFACGIERLVEVCSQSRDESERSRRAYLAMLGDEAEKVGMQAAERLRRAGIGVTLNCGGGKLASQLKQADRSGARIAIIIGDSEVKAHSALLKNLSTYEQISVSLDAIVASVSGELQRDQA